jgi:hypothetical protein
MHYPVKASEDLRKGIAQSAVETDTYLGSTGSYRTDTSKEGQYIHPIPIRPKNAK